MVPLYFLLLVTQVLVVKNYALSVTDDTEGSASVDINLSRRKGTARMSSSKVLSIYLRVLFAKVKNPMYPDMEPKITTPKYQTNGTFVHVESSEGLPYSDFDPLEALRTPNHIFKYQYAGNQNVWL